MDYEQMLQQHCEQRADVTVGCIEVSTEEASGFGVMDIDGDDRITSFLEKQLAHHQCRASRAGRLPAWASMSSKRLS